MVVSKLNGKYKGVAVTSALISFLVFVQPNRGFSGEMQYAAQNVASLGGFRRGPAPGGRPQQTEQRPQEGAEQAASFSWFRLVVDPEFDMGRALSGSILTA